MEQATMRPADEVQDSIMYDATPKVIISYRNELRDDSVDDDYSFFTYMNQSRTHANTAVMNDN